jgi:D-xylose transport system substrate-binding protein
MRRKTLALAAAGAGMVLALAACGNNSGGSAAGGSSSGGSAGNGPKVGVILPDTKSSARWESFDKPLLQQAMKAAGVDADIQNAQGDPQKFATLADGMIQRGVKVLMIVNLSSEGGAAVEKKAQAAGIPTIDYDRLTLGGTADYYVSFNNVKVGQLQAQGMVDCLSAKNAPRGANIIEIEGSPTDNNATLFHQGQEQVLKPKYDSGDYKLVQSQPIDQWDNQKGGQVFEQVLTSNGGKVDGVVAANDGLSLAVITVLQKNGLNGKVPVTGQDATVDGLKALLRGDQCVNVFKPIKQEAESAAKIAIALAKGDKSGADAVATASEHDPQGNRDVKSVLLDPIMIKKGDVKQVIDSGEVKAGDVCSADVAQLCQAAGIQTG